MDPADMEDVEEVEEEETGEDESSKGTAWNAHHDTWHQTNTCTTHTRLNTPARHTLASTHLHETPTRINTPGRRTHTDLYTRLILLTSALLNRSRSHVSEGL